jgi:hypothetical protein
MSNGALRDQATEITIHFAAEPYRSRIIEELCRDEESTLAFNALMESLRGRIYDALLARRATA